MKNAPHLFIAFALVALVAGCATGPASHPRRAVNRIPQQAPEPRLTTGTTLERRDSLLIWPGAPALYRGVGRQASHAPANTSQQQVMAFDESDDQGATGQEVPSLPKPRATPRPGVVATEPQN